MIQRVGHVSCIRCDFETTDEMSFADQDAAMVAHLAEKHPDWMIDGGASILPERMPISDAERIKRLEAALAEMSKPVTDDEWLGLCAGDHVQIADVQRHEMDAFLSARAAKAPGAA
jgi:hypothetical protein